MKTRLPLIFILFIIAFGYAQNSPELKVKGKPLGLTTLNIEVNVVGNIATTTYDMLFYNPTKDVLEGELSFPLGEGHDVSRFALDVNGKLRDAVVVEKELGRIAFEQVVRRGIDPALLEKGTGNNYKARIYPIPANGYKRVLLEYEQQLIYRDGDHYYNLPLNFGNILDQFELEITVFDQKSKPIIYEGQTSGLEFTNWDKNYRTSISKKNFIANKNILVKIPVPTNTEKILTYDNYFYIYKTLSPQKRLRVKPKEVALLWDASLSMKNRNLEKEIQLLDSYFKYLNDVTVNYVSFSNTILSDEQFKIVNGNWDNLKSTIKGTVYDGGTNYDIIYNLKSKVDTKLLFTDGMISLGGIGLDTTKPLFIVNSLAKSNHSSLNSFAELSNGAYINFNKKSKVEAFAALKYENYKFLGYESNSKHLEVYPKSPISITNDFSVSGKYLKGNETITLNFGYGNEIIQRIPININTTNISKKQVKRIWAQKKLDNLEIHSKENKTLITNLGTAYSLVTDYTSMIVLENVRDYITYKITPPNELLEEYNKILAQLESQKNVRHEELNFIMESADMPNAPIIEVMEDEEIIEVEEMNVERVQSLGLLNAFSDMDEEIIEASDVSNLALSRETDDSINISFATIEKPPVFPGCEGDDQTLKECFSEKLGVFIRSNFNLEIANNLELNPGPQRISVIFKITKKGKVKNISIVRSPHHKITEEIDRIIRLLPEMEPGEQRGNPVEITYTLPIIFNVENNGQVIEIRQGTNMPNFKKYSGELDIKKRIVNTKYISQFKQINNKEDAYALYLIQREKYIKIPAYYVDVSNYFKTQFDDSIYSLRILSNIAETDFDNYELLKVFAYQLQDIGEDDLAVFIFKRILELRPEDSQSYRDLALAYEAIGKCQKALDLYNSIITGEIYEGTHRRVFQGITLIAKNEIKHLIKNYKNDLDLSQIDKNLLDEVAYDVRVTVDWNHNDTDIDLHIIDPNLEECFYQHTSTRIGGNMSPDMTQGFGPEEFTLKQAIKGDYYIKIKYYGDRYQKEENPTFMKITIFKNYGSKDETIEIKIIRLTKKDDEEIIAKLSY